MPCLLLTHFISFGFPNIFLSPSIFCLFVYCLVPALICIGLLCDGMDVNLLVTGQREPPLLRPYLAHILHASCNHNAGVSNPYRLGCKAHSFQARPTNHLAAPRWNRVGDPCSHTGLSNRILSTTWNNEHRGCSAIRER